MLGSPVFGNSHLGFRVEGVKGLRSLGSLGLGRFSGV